MLISEYDDRDVIAEIHSIVIEYNGRIINFNADIVNNGFSKELGTYSFELVNIDLVDDEDMELVNDILNNIDDIHEKIMMYVSPLLPKLYKNMAYYMATKN